MVRLVFIVLALLLSACTTQQPYYKETVTHNQVRPRPNPYNTPNYRAVQPRPRPEMQAPQKPASPMMPRHFAPDSDAEERLSAPQAKLVDQAQNHLAHNESDQAASLLERAIRINPQAVKPYRLLAELRLKQGNRQAALELARKGLALIAKKGYPASYNGERARLEQLIVRSQRART